MLERVNLLFDNIDKFINSKILIVGVGGVGGACMEALVRMGLKYIAVIDNDVFDESNLNRQLLSNRNNIGHSKVKEATLRAKSINPDIFVEEHEMFLNESNFGEIDLSKYDYVIDCCDTVTTKLLLIKECLKKNVKIISSMGTGNRVDPTKLEIMSIWKTNYDPLAKVMRKLLRDNSIKDKIMVLSSNEIPMKTNSRTPGSTAFVPNCAGFCIASYVFNDIMK
ncbi:MAG: ThiF family adenylyltransferase [Bacilli bacterium]|nr:ThiF family adenylyltransferase [Bacilli bacterium]